MNLSPLRPKYALALCACLFATAALTASRKPPAAQAAAPSSAASAQRVPITFAAPRGYAAIVDYVKKVASANPSLTDLVEIGKSRGGRPMYVLVVTNMKAGQPMDRLVTLTHPRTPAVDNVLPMKPYHAKPGQWIDGGTRGGGVGAEACLFMIDRLLAGYGDNPEVKRLVDENAFYFCPLVNPDADAGARAGGADEVASNFPEGWWKDDNTPGGTGNYPSSSPEARAVLEFFTNHTNILLVQSFDDGGGPALRPFARWPESRVDPRDVSLLDGVIGKKYQELAGKPGTPGVWRAAYNTEKQAPAGYGVFVDWAYGQFGAFAMSAPVAAGEQAYDAAWQFERYKAGLLPRLQVKEATATVLYTANTATRATASEAADTVVVKKTGAPGRYKIVRVTATVENVGALPTQVARGLQLRGNRQDVVWLLGDRAKLTFVEGARWQPLGVLQGTLPLPRGAAGVESGRGGRGGAAGGGRGGRGESALALAQMREQRPVAPAPRQAGSSRTISWLVAVEGDAPLKIALTSQKGGTITKDLVVQ